MNEVAEMVAQYHSRDMVEAMTQNPRPSTFLLDMFVGGAVTYHDTDVIEIDVTKGGQTMAAYTSRVGDANVVGKKGFSTNLHTIPYIYEEIPFTSKDVKTRLAGQTIYTEGAQARLDRKVGDWLGKLEDRFTVLEEGQVAEAFQTGKIVVKGKDVEYLVDFRMNPENLIQNSGTKNWDNVDTDIVAQLQDMAQIIMDEGAPAPTTLILDQKAGNDFIKNTAILKLLDNRRVNIGEIKPVQVAGQMATFLGDLSAIGLNLGVYVYYAAYTDADTKKAKKYLSDNTCIMTTTAADFRMHYGMIENLKDGDFEGKRFPLIGIDDKGRKGFVSLESSPLFGLHQPDAVVRLRTTDTV